MPDRLDDRHKHIQHPRDQHEERGVTRWIVSTAAAAAWLPYSKLCDTCMTSGYGNPARPERRTATGSVAQNSTYGDHSR